MKRRALALTPTLAALLALLALAALAACDGTPDDPRADELAAVLARAILSAEGGGRGRDVGPAPERRSRGAVRDHDADAGRSEPGQVKRCFSHSET